MDDDMRGAVDRKFMARRCIEAIFGPLWHHQDREGGDRLFGRWYEWRLDGLWLLPLDELERRAVPDDVLDMRVAHPTGNLELEPALPNPCTAGQFKAFLNVAPPGIDLDAILDEFTNDDGSLDEPALARLHGVYPDADALLRTVLKLEAGHVVPVARLPRIEPSRRMHPVGRDVLAPLIERARAAVHHGDDTAQVWAELERLARLPEKERPAPLAGVTSGGVQWRDGGATKVLTRKALRERMRRTRPR